jgi:hypothetical protein
MATSKRHRFASILEEFRKYPLILDADGGVVSSLINGKLRVTEDTKDIFIEITQVLIRQFRCFEHSSCSSAGPVEG